MHSPSPDCNFCPRLCEFRQKNRGEHPSFFNAPVPSFGSLDAQFLVVGLAPGLKGANQTGRPFTGDYAGLILYHSLKKYGFAKGDYKERLGDGFELVNCRVTNAVRCVPPENKPEPSEINKCNSFLREEIAKMQNMQVIVSLGLVSHNAVLKAFGHKPSFAKFTHGAQHLLPLPLGEGWGEGRKTNERALTLSLSQRERGLYLLNSYHTSRYNMNTGRLTQEMFDAVVKKAADLLL